MHGVKTIEKTAEDTDAGASTVVLNQVCVVRTKLLSALKDLEKENTESPLRCSRFPLNCSQETLEPNRGPILKKMDQHMVLLVDWENYTIVKDGFAWNMTVQLKVQLRLAQAVGAEVARPSL